MTSVAAAESNEVRLARDWAMLLDARRWNDSWAAAGTMIKSHVPQGRWASTIEPVRGPLGAVVSRRLLKITTTTSLPGAPDGDYQIVQFQTEFAQKKDAVETVVLAREGGDWKVDGYFIR